jgi:integrase
VSERNRWDVHVAKAPFAHLPVDQVRARDVAAWLREMMQKEASDTRGKRKLSYATVNRAKALASAVFIVAVEREYIESNPCTAKVRRRIDERATKDPWVYLTADEQAALASCDSIPEADRLLIRFALSTGMRQGEVCNLEVPDLHVDGPDPYVFVRYASKRNGQRLPPKSGKTRRVPLLPDGVEAARRWLELLPTYAPSNPDNLVFPTPTGKHRGVGKPLGRRRADGKMICAWKAALREAGVRNCRWHDLRHTAASNLLTGVLGRRWSLEELRVFLGHSSIKVTERYAHLTDEALSKAARETVATATSTTEEGPSIVAAYVARLRRRVPEAVVKRVRGLVAMVSGGAS